MSSVLVGMFDSQAAAAQARSKLMSAGFAGDAVTLTGGTELASTKTSMPAGTTPSDEPQHKGAIARFFDELFGNDDDHDEVRAGYTDTYREAFKRGSYGVSVTVANDDEAEKAEGILNDAGAVDIDEKAAAWRQEGWTGGVARAMGAATGTAAALEAGATRKLQEVEEELKVGKRAVAKGGVRIFTRVTEVPVSATVRLREEHANVKRTTVDRPATEADFAAFKEGSIEVREMGEEAVVSKTARVTGEVEIGKTATEREETINDTVRKTKVDVEQLTGGTGMTGGKTAAYGTGGTGGSENPDPIAGAPGAHPVGTGVGAAAGGIAAGAAAGSVAGPVGTVVSAAVGAVAGGLAGKGVAEKVDPTVTSGKKSY